MLVFSALNIVTLLYFNSLLLSNPEAFTESPKSSLMEKTSGFICRNLQAVDWFSLVSSNGSSHFLQKTVTFRLNSSLIAEVHLDYCFVAISKRTIIYF